jgi:hypothetical protein
VIIWRKKKKTAKEITLALFDVSAAFVDWDGIAKLMLLKNSPSFIVPDSISDVIICRLGKKFFSSFFFSNEIFFHFFFFFHFFSSILLL